MSMMLAIREAEKEAERVLEDHQLSQLPICPFHIAEKVGIVVAQKEATSRGVSGFLMRVGDTFGIMYATHIVNEGFIRFTVAHELGHYFIPGHPEQLFPNGDGVHQSQSGYVSDDLVERQADHFASSLLMPETLFLREMRRSGQGLQAIRLLAETCKTSLTATAIRYAKFTDDPVAVVVSTGDRIDYCIMSDTIRELKGLTWIKRGDSLPTDTATAEFNSDPDNVTGAENAEGASYLDDWFDGAPQIEMSEDVIGLGSYGKTLTVLYAEEWPEEEEDDDHEDW
jgi:Zn-dependent peptidase ImmA (M78 family)